MASKWRRRGQMATTHVDNEINDSFEEIKKLQEKIKRLQKEKDKTLQEKEMKQQEIEPNLKFMSDWLEKYGEAYDEVQRKMKREQDIQDLQRKYPRIDKINDKFREYTDDQREFEREKNINLKRNIPKSQEEERLLLCRASRNKLTPEEKEIYDNQDTISQQYTDYRNGFFQVQPNRDNRNSKETAEEKEIKHYVQNAKMTGCFMKQFIESTHNLFMIQERRIAELEKKDK
uniref:Uncharacterized protein n=1 Tax=Florenciella sp. virus SA2 TaxID=3240092 RepID=A0AB39JEL8_9VIRU